jgi:isopentenyl-diphosphate delta-isomerase
MSDRKSDHIKMALSNTGSQNTYDNRFYYEPLLQAHNAPNIQYSFLGKTIAHPLWISSITGGGEKLEKINHLLAEACAYFKLGISLGSCRTLLESNKYFDDFNIRPVLGQDLPLLINLGVSQLEQLVDQNQTEQIDRIIDKLQADGIFIHVNPTQEWLQPEGNLLHKPPIETIARFIEKVNEKYKIGVKEVGQGIGPKSLKELLKLKIDCIEFGAYGGTNFVNIEIKRNPNKHIQYLHPIANIGHNAEQMIDFVNSIISNNTTHCKQIIVSGGINNFLDGFYFVQKSKLNALYGMAGTILQKAIQSKESLFDFLKAETEGYKFASHFLQIKN